MVTRKAALAAVQQRRLAAAFATAPTRSPGRLSSHRSASHLAARRTGKRDWTRQQASSEADVKRQPYARAEPMRRRGEAAVGPMDRLSDREKLELLKPEHADSMVFYGRAMVAEPMRRTRWRTSIHTIFCPACHRPARSLRTGHLPVGR